MVLIDVNVLVYAHRADTPDHVRYRDWLAAVLVADSAYGISDCVLSGFLRVVTHPRVFRDPTPLETALDFATEIRPVPTACPWRRVSGTGRSSSGSAARSGLGGA